MMMTRGLLVLVYSFLIQATVSSQSEDITCAQCSPYTCRRISGIYTVTVLEVGTYSPVVDIPAKACSINITELGRSDNYIAVSTKGGDGIINSRWALGQPGQYFGAGVRFAYDRNSGSCKGSCIFSRGPTTEEISVEILYNDKNPGITYEFMLPNNVPFAPLQAIPASGAAAPKYIAVEAPESKILTRTFSETPSRQGSTSRTRGNNRRGNRRRSRRRDNRGKETYSSSSYFPYDENTRYNEGRPDVTSALDARQVPQEISIGQTYGTHTLGGRGLSYTYAGAGAETRPGTRRTRFQSRRNNNRDRTSGRHVISRYRPSGTSASATADSTTERRRSDRRRGPSYSRQPQYQGYSSDTASYRDRNSDSARVYNRRTNRYTNNRVPLRGGSSQRYKWKISGFSECSHTCGGGFQKTTIVCISLSSRTQVIVTPENCDENLKPRQQTVTCNRSPCPPAWEAEPWSECSETCGSGTQTRTVECRQRFSSTLTLRVSADECGVRNKPAVAQQCNSGLCSRWSTGPWSECEDCGSGEQSREVKCVDQFDSTIPANYCSEARPRSTQPCDSAPCEVSWWITDWDLECSVSCGEGVRTRRALCMDGKGTVSDRNLCGRQEKPALEQSCRNDAGCRGTWFSGAWEKCSTACGEGVRSRRVVCVQRDGLQLTVTSDDQCDANIKPETEEPCTQSDCRAVWFASSWGECSVSCGDGYRTREVRCVGDQSSSYSTSSSQEVDRPEWGTVVSTRCVSSLRPDTRKLCSLEPCPREPRYQRTDRHEPGTYVDYLGRRGREYTAGLSAVDSGERSVYSVADSSTDDSREDIEEENGLHDGVTVSSYTRKPYSPGRESSRKSQEISQNCKDKYKRKCLVAMQARLCSYPYYQEICCHSCKKFTKK